MGIVFVECSVLERGSRGSFLEIVSPRKQLPPLNSNPFLIQLIPFSFVHFVRLVKAKNVFFFFFFFFFALLWKRRLRNARVQLYWITELGLHKRGSRFSGCARTNLTAISEPRTIWTLSPKIYSVSKIYGEKQQKSKTTKIQKHPEFKERSAWEISGWNIFWIPDSEALRWGGFIRWKGFCTLNFRPCCLS